MSTPTYASLLVDARINVPNQSAAIAAQKGVVALVRLNGPACRAAGIPIADVAAKLVLKVYDVTTGVPVLLKTVAPAGIAQANASLNCQEFGTLVNLVTLLTVAGDYHLIFSWDLAGNVVNAAGDVLVKAADVFPVSAVGRFVAT